MKKKRSAYVSAILILAGVFAVFNLIYVISGLTDLNSIFNSSLPFSSIGDFVFSVLSILVLGIYFFKLYYRKHNLLKWTDISFGFLGLQVIVMRIFYIIETKARISFNSIINQGIGPETSFASYAISLHIFVGIGMVLAIGVMWYTFRKHLKKIGIKD